MSYRRRRATQRQKKNVIGAVILLLSIVAAGGLAVWYATMRAAVVERDQMTLCPLKAEEIRSHVAILIDATDPFLASQVTYVSKYFDELKKDIPVQGKVSVYLLEDFSAGQIAPRLAICNPGDGSNVSQMTGNPQKLQRLWEDAFGKRIEEAINSSLVAPAGSESPLLEFIQSATLSAYPLQSDQTVKRSLIIVSDMLEHSSVMSHYRARPDFRALRDSGSLGHLKPNLGGVEVTILYVSRPGLERSQTRGHAGFWESYFGHYGARIVLVERI